jgi:hypothetical protein
VRQRTLLLWASEIWRCRRGVLLPDLARYVPDVRVARFANADTGFITTCPIAEPTPDRLSIALAES